MGYKDFQVGEVLTSQDVDNFLMRQTVMVFDDSTARTASLGTVLSEGMTTYLKDTDSLEYYDGSDWLNVNDNTDAIPKAVLAAQGDIIYAASSGSATVVSIGTAGQILTTDGTVPSWTTPGDYVDDIITTQGDLIIGDASGDPVRLPVGSADQVLTSDGTTVSFQDAAGGGLGDWSQIGTAISLVGSSSVQLTGLSGYDQVLIQVVNASMTTNSDIVYLDLVNGVIPDYSAVIRSFWGNNGGGPVTDINDQTKLFQVAEGNDRGNGIILFEDCQLTGPTSYLIHGGSEDTSSSNDKTYITRGLVSKNNSELSTVTISTNDTWDIGEVNIWAR